MALMRFREPNQVQWIGTRPAHRGTQSLHIGINSLVDTEIWEVPAGQVYYLTALWLGLLAPNGDEGVQLKIRDDGNALWHIPCRIRPGIIGVWEISRSWIYPIEIPAGYDFYVDLGGTAPQVDTAIEGWIE